MVDVETSTEHLLDAFSALSEWRDLENSYEVRFLMEAADLSTVEEYKSFARSVRTHLLANAMDKARSFVAAREKRKGNGH